MKKICSTLITGALLVSSLAVGVSAHKDFKCIGEVPSTDELIELDGELDEIYKQGLILDIATRTDGKSGGATGKAYLVYSVDTMYCYVDVTDPDVCAIDEGKIASAFWENEGTEFTLDYKNDGSTRHKYMAIYDGHKLKAGDAQEEDFEIACKMTDKGWAIEYEVTMPNDIKAGSDLGINILLDDITDNGSTRNIIRLDQSGTPGDNEVEKFDYITLSDTVVALEVAETAAPVEDVASEDVTIEPTTAPATADLITLALAAAGFSAAGVIASKKRR